MNFNFKAAILKRNKPTLEVYQATDIIVLLDKSKYVYYNGLYNLPRNSFFLNEVLMYHNKDLTDTEECFGFLESAKGLKAQTAKFNTEIYLPMLRWSKNRKIYDYDVLYAITVLRKRGIEAKVLATLDVSKDYSFANVLIQVHKAS